MSSLSRVSRNLRRLFSSTPIEPILFNLSTRLERSSAASKVRSIGLDAISTRDLVQILAQQRSGRTTCHVLGSGSSLCQTVNSIEPDDAIFVCNFGALLAPRVDLYSIEVATPDQQDVSELQSRMVAETTDDQTLILIKNVWQGRVNARFVQMHYPSAVIAQDFLVPLRSGDRPSSLLLDELFSLGDYLPQYLTSVFTLIQLAAFAGYTNIVIHGLDGGGPHYFHLLKTDLAKDCQRLKPRNPEAEAHEVGSPALDFLPQMQTYLSGRGITLTRANISPATSR